MSVTNIPEFEKLISAYDIKKIIKLETTPLIDVGVHYGSFMMYVDATVKTNHGTEEIHAVVKTLPRLSLQRIFNTKTTFRNEIGFYKSIVPALQEFQRECGVQAVIDFSPKLYGSRLNLRGGTLLDANAALVLENLLVKNYRMIDRFEGCDLDVARLVLVNLAHLHAIPLALKVRKPRDFENRVRPFLETWRSSSPNTLRTLLTNLIDNIDEMETHKDRIIAKFDEQMNKSEVREPLATVVHNDCWSNNILVKFENGKAIKTKLVDFQLCNYGSPGRDLVFFLFSSVKSEVLKQNYNDLLKLYHQTFVDILTSLKCPNPKESFAFERLLTEIELEAKRSQFAHVVFMLFPIYAKSEQLVSDITQQHAEKVVTVDFPENLKQKFIFVVNEFIKRNWI